MAYSFRQPDFIQPEEPFWVALAEILDAAGVSDRSIPHVRSLLCAIVFGVLHAELNGALRQWSILASAVDEGASAPDMDHLWGMALDVVIAVVERRFAGVSGPR